MTAGETWLITGGSGFIGRYLCDRLRADGKAVRVFDLLPPEFEVDFVQGDIRDPAAVAAMLQDVTHVVHLAAAHHDHGIDDATYFAVNVDGTRILCEEMAKRGIEQLCFTSSVAVYGEATSSSESNQDLRPINAYGSSKLEAEAVVNRWVDGSPGRTAIVIRPAVVFGPGNCGNMFTLIRAIERGWYWPVGPGDNIKSAVYVENLVEAIVSLAHRGEPGFNVFNYVDKPDLTSRQIADLLTGFLGRRRRPPIPLGLALVIGRVGDLLDRLTKWQVPITSTRVLKLAKMQTQFDCYLVAEKIIRPGTTLEDGLGRMVAWYLAEGRDGDTVSRIPAATIARYPVEPRA